MTITADEVINALEKAIDIACKELDFTDTPVEDAQELLEQYRCQSERKYCLFQRHACSFGVNGIESVVEDENGHIVSHIRQMERELPSDDGWWANWKDCDTSQLGNEWVQVGDPTTLEEVIEWAEGV